MRSGWPFGVVHPPPTFDRLVRYPEHSQPGPTMYMHDRSLMRMAGLRVVFWNVCNDLRAERTVSLRFSRRVASIVEFLRSCDADILVLTEVTRENLNRYLVPALAAYELRMASRAPGEHEFAHAAFFRTSRVFPMHVDLRWFSNTSMHPGSTMVGDHHRGRLLMHVRFGVVQDDPSVRLHRVMQLADREHASLHLVVVHLAVKEDTKTMQAMFVADYLRGILSADPDASILLVGDFNSFHATDSQWETQRGMLSLSGQLTDCEPRTVNRSDGRPSLFTLHPYPYERNVRELLDKPKRFLDGIMFSGQFELNRSECVDNLTIGGPDADVAGLPPSDHHPLLVELNWRVSV